MTCLRIAGLPPIPTRQSQDTWCFDGDEAGKRTCVTENRGSWHADVLAAVDRVTSWVRNRDSNGSSATKAWCVQRPNVTCSRNDAIGSSWQPVHGSADADALREMAERLMAQSAGIIFVGDSQLREMAWGMQWLLRRAGSWQELIFHRDTGAQAAYSSLLKSGCTPEFLGKLGFVVNCATAGASQGRAPCTVHKTDTDGVSNAEAFVPLTNLTGWDRRLTVLRQGQARSKLICSNPEHAFFIAYQPVWGADPLDPSSMPPCLHLADGRYGLRRRNGTVRSVYFVSNGGGLHEMLGGPVDYYFRKRWWQFEGFARHALSLFSSAALRQDVLWVPPGGVIRNPEAGAAWVAKKQKWLAAAGVHEESIGGVRIVRNASAEPQLLMYGAAPPAEAEWLRARGVRTLNFSRLALDYSALMSDARHFTYYWKPCHACVPILHCSKPTRIHCPAPPSLVSVASSSSSTDPSIHPFCSVLVPFMPPRQRLSTDGRSGRTPGAPGP